MAQYTDILETVFKVTGFSQFASALAQASTAAQTLASAQKAAAAGTLSWAGSLGPMVGSLLLVGAAVAILKGTIDLLTVSLKAFSEESKRLFETGVILKNLGSTLTLPQVQQFANTLSQSTGIERPQIEGTAAVLARTGVPGDQIERTLKNIADAARGTGHAFDQAGEAIARGVLGHMRGLAEFGIVLQDTGSKAANLALIQQQLNLRFEGAAEAFRNTLPGAIDAFQSSMQRFLSALGEKFAPAALRVFNLLAAGLDFLTTHVQVLADAIALMLGGPVGLALLHGAQAADAGKNPLADVGHGGDKATEATLLQVADNTKLMADAVTQQVLGGSGEIVNQAFGFLHARLALSI